jgi:hypothetical protein
MILRTLAMIAALAIVSGAVLAEQAVTVQSLLKEGFNVTGAITSPAGPGLFLQKDDHLYFCVVSETPQSSAVTTRYCKPVQ